MMPDPNENYATIGRQIYEDVLREQTEADSLGISPEESMVRIDSRMTEIMEGFHRDPEQEEPNFQGLTWSMISNSNEFNALPLAKKEADRDRFFRDVVLPSVESLEIDEDEYRALSWEHIRRTNLDIVNPKLNKGNRASVSPTALQRKPMELMEEASDNLSDDEYQWIESGEWAKMRAGLPYEPFNRDPRSPHLSPAIESYTAEVDEMLGHFEQMNTEAGMKWSEPGYSPIKDPLRFNISNPFEDVPRYIKTQTSKLYKTQDFARRVLANVWQTRPMALVQTAAEKFLSSEDAEKLREFGEAKGVKPLPFGAEIFPNLVWNSAQFMAALPEFASSVVADPLGTARGMMEAAVYQGRLVSRMMKGNAEAWREFNQRPIDTVVTFMMGRGLMKKVGSVYKAKNLKTPKATRVAKKLDTTLEEVKIAEKVKPQVDRVVEEGKTVEQARIEAASAEAVKAGRVVQAPSEVKISKATNSIIKRADPVPEIKKGMDNAIDAMKEHDRWIRDAEFTSRVLRKYGEDNVPKNRQMLMIHAYEHKMKGKYWDQLTPEEQNIVRYAAKEKAKLNKFIDDNVILERMEEKNVNHIFHHWINPKSGQPYKAMYGKFSKGLPQARQRVIPTYETGIKKGLVPATTNIFELIDLNGRQRQGHIILGNWLQPSIMSVLKRML